MRTTIRLDDELLTQAKALAVRTGRTLTGVIEDALRQALERTDERAAADHFEMITYAGSGLQPGVDLDDSAALQDLLEDRAPH